MIRSQNHKNPCRDNIFSLFSNFFSVLGKGNTNTPFKVKWVLKNVSPYWTYFAIKKCYFFTNEQMMTLTFDLDLVLVLRGHWPCIPSFIEISQDLLILEFLTKVSRGITPILLNISIWKILGHKTKSYSTCFKRIEFGTFYGLGGDRSTNFTVKRGIILIRERVRYPSVFSETTNLDR